MITYFFDFNKVFCIINRVFISTFIQRKAVGAYMCAPAKFRFMLLRNARSYGKKMPLKQRNRTSSAISAFLPFLFAARARADADICTQHGAEKNAERAEREKRNIYFNRENERKYGYERE